MGIKTKADELKQKAGRLLQQAGRIDDRLKDYVDDFLDRGLLVEPIDIRKEILRHIDEKIAVIRPGKRSFPFQYLAIELFAPDHERQAVFEEAFVEANQLQTDIHEYLRQQTGSTPANLRVSVSVQVGPPPADAISVFRIAYHRSASPGTQGETTACRAQLIVLKGTATRKRYTLDKERIYVGRLPQVTDKAGRIVRRNDIVFEDNGDKINQSVSRVHATIRRDSQSGEYRVCDDLSAHGTRIVRDGQPYEAPQRRGLRLKDGDEVFFGEACVRFTQEEG